MTDLLNRPANTSRLRQPLDHHTAVPGFNVKETERPQLIQPVAGTVVTQVSDITEAPSSSSNEEIAIGGALASLTNADTSMVATNHATNVLGASFSRRNGFRN